MYLCLYMYIHYVSLCIGVSKTWTIHDMPRPSARQPRGKHSGKCQALAEGEAWHLRCQHGDYIIDMLQMKRYGGFHKWGYPKMDGSYE